MLLILLNTSFVVQAEVLKFAYTSANSIQSLTSETQIVSALATNSKKLILGCQCLLNMLKLKCMFLKLL